MGTGKISNSPHAGASKPDIAIDGEHSDAFETARTPEPIATDRDHEAGRTIGVATRGMMLVKRISTFLDADIVLARRSNAAACDAIAVWGRKTTCARGRRIAVASNRPLVTLEDGFLRSVGRGDQDPPLSIVVDDLGIYYDAQNPSRLEQLIATPLDVSEVARARALMTAWRAGGVSKYNNARDFAGRLPERFVLVVDQTYRDAAIGYGLADESSFQRMLDAAISENRDCTVVVKTHPDVWAGYKRGHFDLRKIAGSARVQVLAADCHPSGLLRQAEAVYTVTSQLGFEALVWGKPVRCFGMPFYGGWGLTRDDLPAPARRGKASIEQLVHAALVAYPRYVDPNTGRPSTVEAVLDHLALQRRMRARFPETVYACNISKWKRPILRDFLAGSEVRFQDGTSGVPAGAAIAVWGSPPKSLPASAAPIRVEDGFLRSIGLGAQLRRPLSLALDRTGIYYDSRSPSGLEDILATTRFDRATLERAAALRTRLVAEQLTKYNLQAAPWTRPDTPRSVILVPGQVEDDASIRYGAPGIRRNLELLRAVRAGNPEAHIVYKPHPDVVAGLRDGGAKQALAAQECDEMVAAAPIASILPAVDEVHVLTSLAGFEALLRGKPVTCHGQPFFSGWGLTTDMLPVARRVRRLTLDELVAGTLLLYPTYVSPTTRRFITAEQAVDSLVALRGGKEEEIEPLSLRAWRAGADIERRFLALLKRLGIMRW